MFATPLSDSDSTTLHWLVSFIVPELATFANGALLYGLVFVCVCVFVDVCRGGNKNNTSVQRSTRPLSQVNWLNETRRWSWRRGRQTNGQTNWQTVVHKELAFFQTGKASFRFSLPLSPSHSAGYNGERTAVCGGFAGFASAIFYHYMYVFARL